MTRFSSRHLVALAALHLASPALGQTAAPAPSMNAEQALQLFTEAGFVINGGTPTNRCGKPSNPRVAFIDINGDGIAEAHVADVDPACYGKPGAYFAILAQRPDKSWRRIIAEDGIVGFDRARTSGWNNLKLTARDSACPGTRRHNGTDYGSTTACGAAAAIALLAPKPSPAPQPSAGGEAQQAALTGSREERLARALQNVVVASRERTWDAARAAFPGARWEPRKTQAANWLGATHMQSGTINLAGAVYNVAIEGVTDRVKRIELASPGDDNLDWAPIERALRAQGATSQTIGCLSPTGFGFVRVTAGGQRAVMHKFVNYGSRVPSVDFYAFTFDDPFDGRTEAQVASDRSLC